MPTPKKPLLRKLANVEDMATGHFHVVIQIRTEDGAKREITVPRFDCSDPRSLKRKLLEAGAILPARAKVKDFLAAFIDADSPRQLKRVAQSGWLNGNQTFALQTRMIGQDRSSYIGLPAYSRDGDQAFQAIVITDSRGW